MRYIHRPKKVYEHRAIVAKLISLSDSQAISQKVLMPSLDHLRANVAVYQLRLYEKIFSLNVWFVIHMVK